MASLPKIDLSVAQSIQRTSRVPFFRPSSFSSSFLRPPQTKLLWIKSPGNPLLSVTDIAACAEIARKHGILLAVDNTLASPVLTRPLELGADIDMHSATKYLGGHSDVHGGALVVKEPELYQRLYFMQNATGAVMGPLESYLCSRALKTLEHHERPRRPAAMSLASTGAAQRCLPTAGIRHAARQICRNAVCPAGISQVRMKLQGLAAATGDGPHIYSPAPQDVRHVSPRFRRGFCFA
jgi:Cys/Met metabolism PLP-dependent enzyme